MTPRSVIARLTLADTRGSFVLIAAGSIACAALALRLQAALFSSSEAIRERWLQDAYLFSLSLPIGYVAFRTVSGCEKRALQRWSGALFCCAIVIAVTTVLPFAANPLRQSVMGSTRWIVIGGVVVDTSALLLGSALLFIATRVESMASDSTRAVRRSITLSATIALSTVLLWMQPSRSAALIFAIVSSGMIYVTVAPRRARRVARTLYVLGLLSLVTLLATFESVGRLRKVSTPVSVEQQTSVRVMTLAGTWHAAEPLRGETLTMARSESHFFLSAIAATKGTLGLAAMMVVWMFIGLAGMRMVERANDPFTRALACGGSLLVSVPVVIQFCVTLGLAPVMGITLPLAGATLSSALLGWGAIGAIVRMDAVDPNDQRGME